MKFIENDFTGTFDAAEMFPSALFEAATRDPEMKENRRIWSFLLFIKDDKLFG